MQIFRGNEPRAHYIANRLVAVSVALILASIASAQPAPGHRAADPCEGLYKLGFKFESSSTCSNAKCHGAAAGGEVWTNSYTLWSAEETAAQAADPHHGAFKVLRGAPAKAIGAKMGIASPAASATCIQCHALNPPGQPELVAEGVSCNACHGPSGAGGAGWVGWGAYHGGKEKETWKKRVASTPHGEIVKQAGFYNTRPLIERAQRCTSCHLAIDAQMVAAGHPQPMFELNWFSLTYSNRHWADPHDAADPMAPYFEARLWAAGQVVALHDAERQLADRAKDPASKQSEISAAYLQALSHYMVFSQLFSAGGVKGNISAVAAQLTASSKVLADPGKRDALAAAATAAAAATEALNPAIAAYVPAKATTLAMVAKIAQSKMAASLHEHGIEQQRDALFALYDAFAKSADAAPADAETRDTIGQKLFPTDAQQAPLPASRISAADFEKALDEVKARLGVK